MQSLGASAAPMNSSLDGLAQDVLKAQTFTDVLANVASEWPAQETSSPWGGSFMIGGQWNFSSREQAGQDAQPLKGSCLPDSSSNNSLERGNSHKVSNAKLSALWESTAQKQVFRISQKVCDVMQLILSGNTKPVLLKFLETKIWDLKRNQQRKVTGVWPQFQICPVFTFNASHARSWAACQFLTLG